MISFVVKQLVKTVNGNRLETVYESSIERIAIMSYKGAIEEYPDEYFELIKIEHVESCLQFTPKKVIE